MTNEIIIPEYLGQTVESNPHHPQEGGLRIRVRCKSAGAASDGYHSIDELYAHRHMLFCCLLLSHGGWKSKLHSDGSNVEGWFIAGADLLGKQITYHLPDSMWDLCPVPEIASAPEFDGHTSFDVLDRLKAYLKDAHP